MGNIYSQGFCNLSAVAAAEMPTGLFMERPALRDHAFPLHMLRKDCDRDYYGYACELPSRLKFPCLDATSMGFLKTTFEPTDHILWTGADLGMYNSGR